MHGAKVSRESISNMTEVVVDEIKAWQAAPRSNSHSTGIYLPRTLWNSPRRPSERRKRAHSPGGHNAHSLPTLWCSWAERSCVQTHRSDTDATLLELSAGPCSCGYGESAKGILPCPVHGKLPPGGGVPAKVVQLETEVHRTRREAGTVSTFGP
jgi:hypothetical protein